MLDSIGIVDMRRASLSGFLLRMQGNSIDYGFPYQK